jgi:hypothetical protein
MLHIKGTKFYEFKAYFKENPKAIGTIRDVLHVFNYKSVIGNIFNYKTKGHNPLLLFQVVIMFPFLSLSNVHGFIYTPYSQVINACKDAFYDLLSSSLINWRLLLYNSVKRFNKLANNKSCDDSSNGGIKCFIADDSDIEKRGRKFEGISRIFNHVIGKHIFGFKLLVLGLWDGKSFLPVDFSFHNEKGKKKNYGLTLKQRNQRFKKERAKTCWGYKRKKELREKKTTNLLKMLRRALKHGLRANYVLTDAWFCTQDFLRDVRNMKNGMLHVISMCRMDKRNYEVGGEVMNAKAILRSKKVDKKRSRVNKVYYIEVSATYKGIPVKLFFTRLTKRAKWRLIVTTDTSLSFNDTYKIYQVRWIIEVFFKESKQYLGLGKCQSVDFDAQIAATTISFIQYIMLSLHKRCNAYESIGGLFKQCQTNTQEAILAERIWAEVQALIFHFILELELPIELEELLEKIIYKANNNLYVRHVFSTHTDESRKSCA